MTSPLEHILAHWMHVEEATGNNDGPVVLFFTRGDKVPWCAAMILRAIERAGWPKPPCSDVARNRWGAWGWYYENRLVEAFERNMHTLVGAVVESHDVGPNDLVFYADRAGSDAGRGKAQRHIDIVEMVDEPVPGARRLHVIGGNLGNAVKRRTVSVNDQRITSICRLARP